MPRERRPNLGVNSRRLHPLWIACTTRTGAETFAVSRALCPPPAVGAVAAATAAREHAGISRRARGTWPPGFLAVRPGQFAATCRSAMRATRLQSWWHRCRHGGARLRPAGTTPSPRAGRYLRMARPASRKRHPHLASATSGIMVAATIAVTPHVCYSVRTGKLLLALMITGGPNRTLGRVFHSLQTQFD